MAAALFVSPTTVEASLTRGNRKLRITSRAQLGRHMAARGAAREKAERSVTPQRGHPRSVPTDACWRRTPDPATSHLIRSDATRVRDTFPAASRAVTETR